MRVLVFGDSNSWGYLDDGSGQRYARRWPVEMTRIIKAQNPEFEMIEDCLPGRTTDLPDPVMGAEFSGKAALLSSLKAHQPLDLVLIMLGTNDFKARFSRTAEDIAQACLSLIQMVKESGAGPHGWHAQTSAEVVMICPPALSATADDNRWQRYDEWIGGRTKSLALPDALAAICETQQVEFINASRGAESSPRDPIHWQAETHHQFGAYMADQLARYV